MTEAAANSRIAPSTFDVLQAPQDVQRSILLALNTRELVICGRLCRSLRTLIKDDIAIRYKLALARTGRIDGTSSVAIVDRLTALQEHRRAFRAGDHPLKRVQLHPFGSLSSRSDTIFVVGDSVPLWRSGANFAGTEELKITHTVQKLGLEGHRSGSCVVDLTQDLLVFSRRTVNLDPLQVTTELCIYSLSQGEPHPLATQTHIQSNLDFRYSMHTQIVDDLQILGDLLAWNILDGARHEMRVFNWKTGITVWEFTTATLVWWHCRLISESHVVVVAVKSLLIYPIDRDRDEAPPASSTQDTAACVLMLPTWSENVLEPGIPSTRSYIQFPPPPGPDDCPLYQHDPDLTVLTVYLEFRVTTPRRVVQHDQYAIFIPISTLKAQVEMPVAPPPPYPGATPATPASGPRTVEWEEWGPAGTRVVHLEFPCTISSFGCSVALAQKKWAGPSVSLKVFVFDVHPRARPRRLDSRRNRDRDRDWDGEWDADWHGEWDGHWGLVDVGKTLLDTPAFAKRVRTTFPCEFTLRDIPLGMEELSARLVLMEDGLVLVTPAASP